MSKSNPYPSYTRSSGWNALLPARKVRSEAPSEHHFGAIVIGSGVTGLAAARRIAELEPNSRVLLVDAATIGEGSSGRNSGFLINLPHNTGMSGHGSPAAIAKKQIALYNGGLKWLKSLIDEHQIDCGWNPIGKYHAAATTEGEKALRESLPHYREWEVGFRELSADDLAQRLGTRYYRYGYHNENNVFVQPAALVAGLADSLPGNVHLWENEPVLAIEKGTPHRVMTRTQQFTTPRVIIANNGFASRLGFARDRVFTIYTYAGLTPQLDTQALDAHGSDQEWGVIPAKRLGTTLRKVHSGRFMVRSGYSYNRELPMQDVRGLLELCYRNRYPQLKSHALEHVWGGVTALTRNGALYFGRVDDGIFISIGCNGAGMLKGTVFGKLLGEMACGHQSTQLADALGFQRPNWLPPEPLRRLAVVSAIRYQRHLAGSER